MSKSPLEPKLVTVLREGYPREQLFKDVVAGVVVGIVALPLAIAFAIASGVKPEQGLYTAIVAGFIISTLSGSRVQIGGPTGAFIVIVSGIVAQYGYDGLATATLMAGVMLIGMGVAGLGSVIKYIPFPVTVGFTAGIALIIASGQIKDLLGLDLPVVPGAFIEKLVAYAGVIYTVSLPALAIGAFSVGLIILWPKITRRVPGSLVALIVSTALVHGLELPVETIGGRFGTVPGNLPAPRWPGISLDAVATLFSPALSIALLAGIESLLSAVVADGMTGRRHRSNMELIGQGVANMVSPVFGGIPATGAIARTATNIKNGGRTPVAGMVHAVVLLLIMVFFGKWAALIPMATLAGILLVVAYNMSEWRLFVKLFHGPRSDVLVLLTTFLLTVLLDLTVAIQVGVVLAALLFMRRMADVTHVGRLWFDDEEESRSSDAGQMLDVPPGVEIYEVNGPFFFGAADKFKDALGRIETQPRVLILRLRHVPAIDATGLVALEEVHERTVREGTQLVLSGVHAQPLASLKKAGLLAKIGDENVHPDLAGALARSRTLTSDSKSRT